MMQVLNNKEVHNMNKKVVEYGKKVIGKLAKTIAVKDANTTCPSGISARSSGFCKKTR